MLSQFESWARMVEVAPDAAALGVAGSGGMLSHWQAWYACGQQGSFVGYEGFLHVPAWARQ